MHYSATNMYECIEIHKAEEVGESSRDFGRPTQDNSSCCVPATHTCCSLQCDALWSEGASLIA